MFDHCDALTRSLTQSHIRRFALGILPWLTAQHRRLFRSLIFRSVCEIIARKVITPLNTLYGSSHRILMSMELAGRLAYRPKAASSWYGLPLECRQLVIRHLLEICWRHRNPVTLFRALKALALVNPAFVRDDLLPPLRHFQLHIVSHTTEPVTTFLRSLHSTRSYSFRLIRVPSRANGSMQPYIPQMPPPPPPLPPVQPINHAPQQIPNVAPSLALSPP